MKKLILSIVTLVFLFIVSILILAKSTHPQITDYHQIFMPCYDKSGQLRIAIRMYYYGSEPYFLAVDPYNFNTQVHPANYFNNHPPTTLKNSKASDHYTMHEIENTPYMKALSLYALKPYSLENYGLTAANHATNGQFLTIDMCPSAKPFESNFFKALVARTNQTHQPTPIAIAISGFWIINHPKELNWLIAEEKANKLKITWINHTFGHVYFADLSLERNFLLSHATNFSHEILETEKLLLENHQVPSVFFRFPGLVSNEKLILELSNYSLIPVSSNAWLAKDQPVKPGAIILVHGNSNEPEGIKKFMDIFKQGNIQLLPLNQAL